MHLLRTILERLDFRPASRRQLNQLRREMWELHAEWESTLDQLSRLTKRYAQRERREANAAMKEPQAPEPAPEMAPRDGDPSLVRSNPLASARRDLFMRRINPNARAAVAVPRVGVELSDTPSGLQARRVKPPEQETTDEPTAAAGEGNGPSSPNGAGGEK